MAWIPVPKPTETTSLGFSGGEPIGLLMALTQTILVTSVTSGWGNADKPTVASWTSVAKPTSSVWTMVTKPNT